MEDGPTEKLRQALGASDYAAANNLLDDHPELLSRLGKQVHFACASEDELEFIHSRRAELNQFIDWYWVAAIQDIKFVDSLLAHGADIEKNREGTPLYWSAYWGRDDLVEYLLSRGANPNNVDLEKLSRSGYPKGVSAEKRHQAKLRIKMARAGLQH
jgi:hypothetical protein